MREMNKFKFEKLQAMARVSFMPSILKILNQSSSSLKSTSVKIQSLKAKVSEFKQSNVYLVDVNKKLIRV